MQSDSTDNKNLLSFDPFMKSLKIPKG